MKREELTQDWEKVLQDREQAEPQRPYGRWCAESGNEGSPAENKGV